MQNIKQSSSAYSWYIVFLCMIAYIFSQIDRQIITLLVEPIKADLQISDTQFSLLHGLAFSIFYAVMGVPIARLADRKSRPVIIATGIFVWSLATAACGMAKNFWQLFVARMGVGVGEAALSPAAYSMIADLFSKSRLGFALGVYSVGSLIGTGLAFLIGGAAYEWVEGFGDVTFPFIGVLRPWQVTFFIVGIPGMLISAIFFLTVRDPERKGATEKGAGYSLREVLAYIKLHKQTFVANYFGFGFAAMAFYAILAWAPAFLIRNYGLSTKEVGFYLGVLVLVSNTSGVLVSGWLTDYFTKKGYQDSAFRTGVVASVGVLIPAALFSSMPTLYSMLLVYAVGTFFISFSHVASATSLQLMAPNQMRAQVTALFFLFLNLFGITGGSLLVALCTDYLFKDDVLVGYSMSLVGVVAAVLAALLLRWGYRYYAETVNSLS